MQALLRKQRPFLVNEKAPYYAIRDNNRAAKTNTTLILMVPATPVDESMRFTVRATDMKTLLDKIELATTQPLEIIDISHQLRQCCARSSIRAGLVTLISRHTTAYVNLNESEPQLQLDMLTFLKRFIPRDGDYRHNVAPVDDRDNAHAHLLGLFMNASESIPIVDGKLMLGDWQSVFFIELDGPRSSRTLTLQFLGEG